MTHNELQAIQKVLEKAPKGMHHARVTQALLQAGEKRLAGLVAVAAAFAGDTNAPKLLPEDNVPPIVRRMRAEQIAKEVTE